MPQSTAPIPLSLSSGSPFLVNYRAGRLFKVLNSVKEKGKFPIKYKLVQTYSRNVVVCCSLSMLFLFLSLFGLGKGDIVLN